MKENSIDGYGDKEIAEEKPTHRLIRIASRHNAMRTDTMDGWLMGEILPEVGKCFYMVGLPLNPKASHRIFNTSEIKEVSQTVEGALEFVTENSIYRLERLNNR